LFNFGLWHDDKDLLLSSNSKELPVEFPETHISNENDKFKFF